MRFFTTKKSKWIRVFYLNKILMNERSDEPIGWRQVEKVGQVIDNLSTKEGPCMSEPAFFPTGPLPRDPSGPLASNLFEIKIIQEMRPGWAAFLLDVWVTWKSRRGGEWMDSRNCSSFILAIDEWHLSKYFAFLRIHEEVLWKTFTTINDLTFVFLEFACDVAEVS